MVEGLCLLQFGKGLLALVFSSELDALDGQVEVAALGPFVLLEPVQLATPLEVVEQRPDALRPPDARP